MGQRLTAATQGQLGFCEPLFHFQECLSQAFPFGTSPFFVEVFTEIVAPVERLGCTIGLKSGRPLASCLVFSTSADAFQEAIDIDLTALGQVEAIAGGLRQDAAPCTLPSLQFQQAAQPADRNPQAVARGIRGQLGPQPFDKLIGDNGPVSEGNEDFEKLADFAARPRGQGQGTVIDPDPEGTQKLDPQPACHPPSTWYQCA